MRLSALARHLLYGVLLSPVCLCISIPQQQAPVPNSEHDLVSILSNAAKDPLVNQRVSSVAAGIKSGLATNEVLQQSGDEQVQLALKKIEVIFTKKSSSTMLDFAKDIVASGLVPPKILTVLNGYLNAKINSAHNLNPDLKSGSIYPSKATEDAPYSIPEAALREAIHMPSVFSWENNSGRRPVLLVPGTAAPAGTSFYYSFGKLGNAIPELDVAWVNIPQASLGDVQVTAEYIAYSINYISNLYQSKVNIISWSQGGLNTQWALKYWPSTRGSVEDFIAISPDFRGTVEARLVCPWLAGIMCTPALWQQRWDAKFVRTLRALGGESAYVHTTTIYSSFDEVVQPMDGDQASAIIQDARGVGVSNNHLQSICAHKPAGGLYTHKGVLYNPLAWALTIDALTHDGPGNPSRVNVTTVCQQSIPPQLGLDDLLGTEGLLLVALSETLRYRPKTFAEPDIIGYAASAPGVGVKYRT
ncbi:hypothetical protein ABZX51_003659 [Aspergillus tubingensis]|uniref:Lipase n=1 Tax=Aspergillus tubingensis (strain CBS 134.48) TaxID=767770 RepID=A0A1L9NER9_ASPTC|nr:hypothetical protein ASPTUDRAFT_36472 [Aspergillus tubingensis CBS 134.48]